MKLIDFFKLNISFRVIHKKNQLNAMLLLDQNSVFKIQWGLNPEEGIKLSKRRYCELSSQKSSMLTNNFSKEDPASSWNDL